MKQIKIKSLNKVTHSPISQTVCAWYRQRSEEGRRDWMAFGVPGLPPTINHCYIKTRYSVRLTPEAKNFKELVRLSLVNKRHSFKPKGVIGVVIQLCSPNWVTKKLQIRKMDADNRIKTIVDAVKEAFEDLDDSAAFEICTFKVLTRSEETRVYLYDLGEVVEYFV